MMSILYPKSSGLRILNLLRFSVSITTVLTCSTDNRSGCSGVWGARLVVVCTAVFSSCLVDAELDSAVGMEAGCSMVVSLKSFVLVVGEKEDVAVDGEDGFVALK